MHPRCGSCSRRTRPHCVMNLAAESHVDRSIDGPAEFIQTNIVGTFTLLQEALRHWRGLDRGGATALPLSPHLDRRGLSARSVPSGLFTETTPYAPNSPYSAIKASSDHLVRAWRETYGLPTLVTNCSNNYGPYHFPEKLIPHMIITRPRRTAVAGLRQWRECARLALRRGSRPRAVACRRATVCRARLTISAAANERSNIDVVRRRYADCSTNYAPSRDGSQRGVDYLRRRPAGPRSPLRDRSREDRARARLARRRELRDRACQDGALVS